MVSILIQYHFNIYINIYISFPRMNSSVGVNFSLCYFKTTFLSQSGSEGNPEYKSYYSLSVVIVLSRSML